MIRFKYKIYKTKQRGGEMYYYNINDDERYSFDEDTAYFADFRLPQPNIYEPKSVLSDQKGGDILPSLPLNLKIGTKFIGLIIGNRRIKALLEYEGWAYDKLPITEEQKEMLKKDDPAGPLIYLVFRKIYGNKRLYVFRDYVGVDNRTKVIAS